MKTIVILLAISLVAVIALTIAYERGYRAGAKAEYQESLRWALAQDELKAMKESMEMPHRHGVNWKLE